MPPFTTVIRSAGDAAALDRLAAALNAQSLRATETLLISNSSRQWEATFARCHGFEYRVVPNARTVGAILNAGCLVASSELMLHLSSSALPLGPRFLETLFERFEDPGVVAVRCINVTAINEMQRWATPLSNAIPDSEGSVLLSPNDNCFAIRRSAWERISFDDTLKTSCDKLWARRQLEHGSTVAVCGAFYFLPDYSGLVSRITTFNEQTLTYYLATGTLIEHDPVSLGRVLRACLIGAPKAALRIALGELGRYLAVRSIPLQAGWIRRTRIQNSAV